MTKKIYLDNGATTKVADEAVDEMNIFFSEKYGNASSLHSLGEEAKKSLFDSRMTIAKSLNADFEEIIFTSGGTESDNLAIQETAYPNKAKGNHIITTKIEHPAILRTCEFLEKDGFEVTYLDVDIEGFVKLDELEEAITDKTILVSIIHGNNEVGTIQDIEKIGELCKRKGVLFHTDAVQSFTKVPIDTKKINVDLISMSGHKIHGPKGIGALFVRKGTNIHPLFYGGSHEFKIRPGTENISGAAGFAKSVEIDKGIDKMVELRDYFIDRILNEINNTQLNGPKGDKRLCNNINISFDFVEGESILLALDQEGIAVSTGSACSSKSLDPSHVLVAMGIAVESAHGSIRFTISRYTTKEELDHTVDKLKEIIERLRKLSPLGK